jgi:hypothetical protein
MSGNGVERSIEPPDATFDGRRVTAEEIVVTVGDSPAALELAVEASRRTGRRLRIVHAWQVTAAPSAQVDASFWVASAADARARATRWVLDALGDRAASVPWTLDIVERPSGPITPASTSATDAELELSSQPGGNT